jgi:hypothetical protein
MKKQLWLMALLALSVGALGACGGDDGDSTPAPEEDAGGSGGSGGTAGTDSDAGGTGGMGGAGAGGTGGGGPVAMPVECGAVTCQPPTNPFAAFSQFLGDFMLPATGFACCMDEAAGECGYSMTVEGGTCNEPAVPDTRCPDFSIPIEIPIPGFEIPPVGVGCCVENKCGVDGQLFGNGCTENDAARAELMAQPMLGAFLVDGVPDARACDAPQDAGTDGSIDDDAGN